MTDALVPAHMETFDCWRIGSSFESLASALRATGSEPLDSPTPYPWCYGYPTQAACIAAGYCRRNPSCGD